MKLTERKIRSIIRRILLETEVEAEAESTPTPEEDISAAFYKGGKSIYSSDEKEMINFVKSRIDFKTFSADAKSAKKSFIKVNDFAKKTMDSLKNKPDDYRHKKFQTGKGQLNLGLMIAPMNLISKTAGRLAKDTNDSSNDYNWNLNFRTARRLIAATARADKKYTRKILGSYALWAGWYLDKYPGASIVDEDGIAEIIDDLKSDIIPKIKSKLLPKQKSGSKKSDKSDTVGPSKSSGRGTDAKSTSGKSLIATIPKGDKTKATEFRKWVNDTYGDLAKAKRSKKVTHKGKQVAGLDLDPVAKSSSMTNNGYMRNAWKLLGDEYLASKGGGGGTATPQKVEEVRRLIRKVLLARM